MSEAADWIREHWTDILLIWTSIVTIASIIVKFTPTPKDDTVLDWIKDKLSRYVAINKKDAH